MIQSGVFPAVIFNIIISVGIPLGAFVFIIAKKTKSLKPFFIGMLAFFVSQFVIRIPILQNVLPRMGWFQALSQNLWLYAGFLGVTAALFEETARWIAMKFLLKDKQRRIDGISFGLGHGGIESILLVGLSNLSILIYIKAVQGGTFDQMMQVVPPETSQALKEQLLSLTPLATSMGGLERIFAILFHVACSLIVLKSIRDKKAWCYWLAVLLHTLLDAGAVIIQGLSNSIYAVEVFAALFALGSIFLAVRLFGKDEGQRAEAVTV